MFLQTKCKNNYSIFLAIPLYKTFTIFLVYGVPRVKCTVRAMLNPHVDSISYKQKKKLLYIIAYIISE